MLIYRIFETAWQCPGLANSSIHKDNTHCPMEFFVTISLFRTVAPNPNQPLLFPARMRPFSV